MKVTANQFISQHKEQEPLSEFKCQQYQIDEYIANDAERVNNSTNL
jgi:hypothetical protein